MKFRILLLTLFAVASNFVYAQTDTRFWFAAPEITAGHGDEPIFIRVATFADPAVVTISIPSNPGFTPIVFAVPANTAISQDITAHKALVEANHNVVCQKGILVESTKTITAYYEVARTNNTDIFALKGRNALGTKFYMPFEHHWNHQTGLSPMGHTAAVVVATQDNTNVTFTPTKNIVFGGVTIRPANVPFTVTLDRGEVYSLSHEQPTGANTAVGTLIESDQPIAVTLSQDSKRTGAGGCYDIFGDQLVPVNILGTEYIIMRGFLGDGGTAQPEKVVITATENGTTATFNGVAVPGGPFNAGQSRVVDIPAASLRNSLFTNKPVYVMHYSGFGCEGGGAIIPPMVCTGSRKVYFTRSTNEFFGVTLLVGAGHEGNFTINGSPIPATHFAVVPGSGGAYMSAQISYPVATVPVGAASVIENSTSLFHLGVINGGASSGCRYGYFSSFNAVSLGPDITVSYGSTITLDAGTPFGVSYLWNTGQTTQTIDVGIWELGNYWVQVDMGICTLSDTVCVGTYEYVWMGYQDNNWNNPNNWSKPCNVNTPPDCNTDVIFIQDAIRFPIIRAADGEAFCRKLDMRANTAINFHPTGALNICGDFLHAGNFNMVPGSTVRFTGYNQGQVYSFKNATASGEFENVVINNTTPNTSSLRWDYVVVDSTAGHNNMIISPTGSLTLLNGVIQTNAVREVVVKNRAASAVTMHNVGSFVAGRIRRYTNPTGSYDYPVGLALPILPNVTNTKTATFNGTPAWTNGTICGSSTTFLALNSASSHRVNLPSSALVYGSTPRTIMLWARTTAFNGGALFAYGNTTGTNAVILRTRNGVTNGWRIETGGSGFDFTLAGSSTGWHHYALTYDGGTLNLYYDGVLAQSVNIGLNTADANRAIGRYPGGTHFSGDIDDFKCFNINFTAAEINQRKCERYGCALPPPANLISYYDFEEGAGTQAHYKVYTCPAPVKTYQLANINLVEPNTPDNFLAFFNKYGTVPGPTGQLGICGANWNVCNALNNGFWSIKAFLPGMIPTAGSPTARYDATLYNRDYSNACSGGTVMKRSVPGDPWSIPTGGCLNDDLNSVSRGWLIGFSDFGTAQSNDIIILPVELVALEAQPSVKSIFVKWKTVSEKMNTGFEVLRSEDGLNFDKIGFVSGKGTTAQQNNYVFEDMNVRPGKLYYYRLRQIDEDGKFNFTRIVSAMVKASDSGEGLISVYPNPTNSIVTLDFAQLDAKTYRTADVQIISPLGVELERFEFAIADKSLFELSLEKYAAGMYIFVIQTGDLRNVIKVQKQ